MAEYNLGTASGRIVVNGDAAAAGFKVAETAAASFFSAVKDKVTAVEDTGKKLTKVGAAGVAAFGIAVKAASSFETGLSGIQAVSGATTEQMDKIREAALRIGKDTSFSASEAALAFEELIKAGVSVEDALQGGADAAVSLAAAGGVSLPEAAELAATALNSFGLKANELPKVADAVAGAANASAISVGEFRQSLSQVGAVANLTGVSFRDTAVAIAELGNAGIKGSDAGTSLKTFLTNLIPTTDRQAEEFRRLGLQTFEVGKAMQVLKDNGVKPLGSDLPTLQGQMKKLAAELTGTKEGSAKAEKEYLKLAASTGVLKNQFFDAEGNIKSFAEVQEILKTATAGMTKEQKLASLELLFGSDALRAAAVFADEGAAGFNRLSAEIAKVSAADVAKTRLDNLSGSVEELKGSFETALITIGSIILPFVRKVVDGMTAIVNVFNNLPTGVQTAIGVFFALLSVGSLLIGALISMAFVLVPLLAKFLLFGQLRAIAAIFINFTKVLYLTRSATAAYAAATTAANAAMTRFTRTGKIFIGIARAMGIAWAVATGPIGLIVLAIAALVGAAILAYKNFEPFRNLVDGIAATLREKFGPAIQQIVYEIQQFGRIIAATAGPALEKITTTFTTKLLPVIKAVASALVADLVPKFQMLAAQVAPIVAAVTGFVQGLFSANGAATRFGGFITGTLIPAFLQIRTAIAANVLPILASIASFFIGTILPVLVQVAGFLTGVFVTAIIGAFNGIIQAVTGLYNVFAGIVNFFKAIFTGDLQGAWDAIKQIFFGAFDLIVGALKVWLNLSVLKVFALGFTLIKGIISAGWGFIKAIFTGAFNAIRGTVSSGTSAISSVFTTVFNFIRNLVTTIFTGIQTFITTILTVYRTIITTALNAIRTVFTTIFNGIRTLISTIFEAIRLYFTTIFTAYRTLFTAAFTAIRTIVTTIFTAIRTTIQTILTAIQTVFTTVFNAVRTLITTIFNGIRSTVTSVFGGIRDFLSGAVTAIRTGLTNGFNAAKTAVLNAFTAMRTGVSTAIGNLISLVRGIPGRILSALGNLGKLLVGAGTAIMDGLIGGVKAGIDKLKSTLGGITKLIPDLKGPPKTDAVLLMENGQLIMQGLIRGIESQVRPLTTTLAGITDNIPAAISVPPAATETSGSSLTGGGVTVQLNFNGDFNGDAQDAISSAVEESGMLDQIIRAARAGAGRG